MCTRTFLFIWEENGDENAQFTLSVPIGRRVLLHGHDRFVEAFSNVSPGWVMDDWLEGFTENMSEEDQHNAEGIDGLSTIKRPDRVLWKELTIPLQHPMSKHKANVNQIYLSQFERLDIILLELKMDMGFGTHNLKRRYGGMTSTVITTKPLR